MVILETLSLKKAERILCQKALDESEGSVVTAAKKLDITRHALRRRIKKLGLVLNKVGSVSSVMVHSSVGSTFHNS